MIRLMVLASILSLIGVIGCLTVRHPALALPPLPPRWRARWRGYWFSASPLRALGETLLIQAPMLLWAVTLAPRETQQPLIRFGGAFITLAGPACILYCVFHLRAPVWPRGMRLALYAGLGVAVGLVPSVIITVIWQTHAGEVSRPTLHVPSVLLFCGWLTAFTAAFLLSRLGARLLVLWNRLRRKSLLWSLTHAHLLVVVLGSGVLTLLQVSDVVSSSDTRPFLLLPGLFVIFVVTVILVLVVLPPSALFSYLFARHTTRRLQTLAVATTTLRMGNYGIHVPVEGEDEVAQLQANFNAMAADLAHAVGELEAERDTVARLLAARRELVASVSHELRTPVATLRSYLESMRTHWDATPPPTLRHDLAVMERETIRLQALIDDLFTLSRAEIGRLELHSAPVALAPLLHGVADTMAPLAWGNGRVELIVDAAPMAPPALADANRLEQVLCNLLHNAIRHTPPGGIVVLGLETDDVEDAMLLRVKDTGEGMSPEELPHIWERFYRTERSRSRADGGTGLGLALVKDLTEAMGGTVSVASARGQGSCFTVRLPRAPSDAVLLGEDLSARVTSTEAR
jgi:signal transduction histidine kinase